MKKIKFLSGAMFALAAVAFATTFTSCEKEENDNLNTENLMAEKVPEKLQSTLDKSFAKAFCAIFEKGTGVIEKTYRREELEKTYQINKFTNEVRQNRKSLKAFSKLSASFNKNSYFFESSRIYCLEFLELEWECLGLVFQISLCLQECCLRTYTKLRLVTDIDMIRKKNNISF